MFPPRPLQPLPRRVEFGFGQWCEQQSGEKSEDVFHGVFIGARFPSLRRLAATEGARLVVVI